MITYLESTLVSTQDTCRYWSRVNTDTNIPKILNKTWVGVRQIIRYLSSKNNNNQIINLQISSIGTQDDFELCYQMIELSKTLTSEAAHDDGMVLNRFWQTSHGDVTITDSFNFEQLTTLGSLIECLVDCFQQGKDLSWVPYWRPGGKAGNAAVIDGIVDCKNSW